MNNFRIFTMKRADFFSFYQFTKTYNFLAWVVSGLSSLLTSKISFHLKQYRNNLYPYKNIQLSICELLAYILVSSSFNSNKR